MRCALVDQAREQPGGEALLAAAYEGVHLVGGAVRDLLRIEHPRELDVLVEGEIEPLLRALDGEAVMHDRFGTASVWLGDVRIDVARARREHYPHPGALPVVEPASVAEDLLRRDFTVNAIAVRIDEGRAGEVHAAPGALEDLAAGRLRVLHDASFIDDPTRLLRLARYQARLRFVAEDHTAALAREAIAAQALDTVSGARIGAELRLALAEDDAIAALAAMDDLGLLSALHPRLHLDRQLVGKALELLPDDGRPDLLLMSALTLPFALRAGEDQEAGLRAFLDRLEFPAGDRDRVVLSARAGARLGYELDVALSRSRLRAVVGSSPPEGVALAGAQGDAGVARSWLEDVRHVRLQIDGEDLLAAGVPEGPEIGYRLKDTLCRKLDGELDGGREAELRAALESKRERS